MSLEAGIKAAISGVAGVSDIVGTRIRPVMLAQDDDRPYITYQVTERQSYPTLADGPAEHKAASIEVGYFADDYDTAAHLSDLVRDALDQYAGTAGGVEFAPVAFGGESDVEETTPEGEETPIFVRVQTYRTLYRLT
jgi:hypothetical protein